MTDVFKGLPGLSVTACSDPRDALEHIRHRPVDVVLTDLFMGCFSGMDILLGLSRTAVPGLQK